MAVKQKTPPCSVPSLILGTLQLRMSNKAREFLYIVRAKMLPLPSTMRMEVKTSLVCCLAYAITYWRVYMYAALLVSCFFLQGLPKQYCWVGLIVTFRYPRTKVFKLSCLVTMGSWYVSTSSNEGRLFCLYIVDVSLHA